MSKDLGGYKLKVLIADCLSKINAEGFPCGHYIHFFGDMEASLKKSYEVVFGCSKEYQAHLDGNIFNLCPSLKIELEKKLFWKLINKVLHYLKLRKALKSSCEAVILQSGFLAVQCLALLFTNRSNIFLVIHEDLISGSRIKRLLYNMARHKISGIITTDSRLEQVYDAGALVIPDYFNRKVEDGLNECVYDVAMLGVINTIKNVESVVEAFSNRHNKVIIAGYFESKERYQELFKRFEVTPNITIIDKYLETEEYEQYFLSSRYIVLPYLSSNYKSSGIFYEALYKLKPLIVSDTPFLDVVKTKNLGLQYRNSPAEIIEKLDDHEMYRSFIASIRKYIETETRDIHARILDYFQQNINENRGGQ